MYEAPHWIGPTKLRPVLILSIETPDFMGKLTMYLMSI